MTVMSICLRNSVWTIKKNLPINRYLWSKEIDVLWGIADQDVLPIGTVCKGGNPVRSAGQGRCCELTGHSQNSLAAVGTFVKSCTHRDWQRTLPQMIFFVKASKANHIHIANNLFQEYPSLFLFYNVQLIRLNSNSAWNWLINNSSTFSKWTKNLLLYHNMMTV